MTPFQKRADILIVDDIQENHLVYATSLADLDQNLIIVSSGEEALRQILDHDFAVILLDVNMPGLSGHETAKLIRQRKRSRHTPIIFVTAFADAAQAAEGYALGAVDYILTPIVPEILRAKVKVFVELHQMRSELAQSHALLEKRVAQRTAELAATAERLAAEVAERRKAEERLTVMVRELNHRVRNLLAVLRSIAARTLTPGRTIEEAAEMLCGRLQALGNAHDILTNACWSGAPLGDIVSAELAGFSERIRVSGPHVMLSASSVQTFALIVHELSTNAAKYGALSNADGEVEITWKIVHEGDDPFLAFRWAERGGPPVAGKRTAGFGLSLIAAMGRSLTAQPVIEFNRAGLVCSFRVPLDVISPPHAASTEAGCASPSALRQAR